MKLYITETSPYARIPRIVILEKGLERRVEIIAAETRVPHSPYYSVNPSGRVPYLVRDDGVGLEEAALICAYLNSLLRWRPGHPKLSDWFDHIAKRPSLAATAP